MGIEVHWALWVHARLFIIGIAFLLVGSSTNKIVWNPTVQVVGNFFRTCIFFHGMLLVQTM